MSAAAATRHSPRESNATLLRKRRCDSDIGLVVCWVDAVTFLPGLAPSALRCSQPPARWREPRNEKFMYDHQLLADALTRYTRALPTLHEGEFVLDHLVDAVTGVLGLTDTGVTVVEEDRLWFVTASAGNMAEMELWQERYQVGPAPAAGDEGVAVLVADIGDCDDRWPLFAAAAHQAGVMAVGAIPMRLGADIIGVLDLYSATRRDWPDADVAAAQLLADMATGYLVSHLH